MMQGYDKEEARSFILARIHRQDHAELADQLEKLIAQAIDADIAFMHESGVLDEEGYAGEGYYEEDEALEYMVERLAEDNDLSPEQAVKVAALIDDFMDAQEAYLRYKGLASDE